MTFNKRTRTVSARCNHEAYDVLKWYADLTGEPLCTTITNFLHDRAEQITSDFDKLETAAAAPAGDTVAAMEAVLGAADPADAMLAGFASKVAAELGVDIADVEGVHMDADGIIHATVAGTDFNSTPPPLPHEENP